MWMCFLLVVFVRVLIRVLGLLVDSVVLNRVFVMFVKIWFWVVGLGMVV